MLNYVLFIEIDEQIIRVCMKKILREIEYEYIESLMKIRKRQSYKKKKSKLDQYRSEILTLRSLNKSYEFIQLWLQKEKIVKTARSTIYRRVKQWNEGIR